MVKRKAEIFLFSTCGACIILALIMYSQVVPSFNAFIKSMTTRMIEFGITYGLWSALLLSFFGNTSVFLVIPYTYIVWMLAANAGQAGGFPWWYPLILGIISGLGAGVGEVTSYVVGRLFATSDKLQHSQLGQKFERMRQTFEKHPKLIPVIIYLFALTPLPDDVILVPFGVMKYSYWKTVIPCMLGKMSLTTLVSLAGFYFAPIIQQISWLSWIVPSAESDPGEDILSLIPLFVIIYLMIRVDFEKLMSKFKRKKSKVRLEVEPAVITDDDLAEGKGKEILGTLDKVEYNDDDVDDKGGN
ncbi:MAG: VTT domain-containing protein [Promethearchaeota archaeon]